MANEVLIPPSIFSMSRMKEIQKSSHLAQAVNLNAPITPAEVRQVNEEEVVDVPGASVHDHDGVSGKLAHIMSEIAKDSIPNSEKKKLLVQALKVLDQDEKPAEAGAAEVSEPPAEVEGEPAEEPEEEEEEEEPEEEPEMDEAIKELKTSSDPKDKELYESVVAVLKEERKAALKLDAKKAAEAKAAKIAKARQLCTEHKLEEYREITDVLLEEIAGAGSDRLMKAMVKDKLDLASRQRPVSMASHIGGGPKGGSEMKATEFAAELTR